MAPWDRLIFLFFLYLLFLFVFFFPLNMWELVNGESMFTGEQNCKFLECYIKDIENLGIQLLCVNWPLINTGFFPQKVWNGFR